MKPAPFVYHAPATVAELLELATEHGDSGRVLAGGQSLVPLLNMRRVEVDHLIDLNRVEELDRVDDDDRSLVVGALVRQARALADPTVRAAAPLVAEALEHVASPTVRNRGTVCGNVVFAQPGAELPAVVLAMGGAATAKSATHAREIDFNEFFTGPNTTALRPGEVVTEIRLDRWPASAGHAFLEVSRVRLPVVSAAVLVELDGAAVSRCAIALSGVAGTPVRATAAERQLAGVAPTDDAQAEAGARATEGLDALSGVHGTPDYRIQVAQVLVRRGLRTALERVERERARAR